ncbi:hypothetical protein H5410_042419 [Solanum commersonii]|uniref:DUF4283 domain-containing protein n=1 Tax=Solanum commersonii TaxID=4109 RepID=A0A9J5XUN7_SOLCO|nr:hypothetical protein H5410_042419 [Solanum commersonii]
MDNSRFLFEFSDRFMADQVLQHQWHWQKNKFNIKWWKTTVVVAQRFLGNWRSLWGMAGDEGRNKTRESLTHVHNTWWILMRKEPKVNTLWAQQVHLLNKRGLLRSPS